MWEFPAAKTDRIDRLLRNCQEADAKWLSRAAWEELFSLGRVRVGGRVCSKPGAEVGVGTQIQVDLPGPLGVLPSGSPAHPLWLSPSRDFGLFSKPCGVATHALLPWDQSTFASRLSAFANEAGLCFADLSEPPNLEGGLLQRLDLDTSGIVSVAFRRETKVLFRKIFSESLIEKSYLALTSEAGAALAGEHVVWLAQEGGAKVKASLRALQGKSEESRLRVEVLNSSSNGALVRIRTRGGARHVVRAGMAALGAPLVGDEMYGGSAAAPHHQLHAQSLHLLKPSLFPGFPESLEAPPPKSFLDSASSLGLHFSG